MTLGQLLRCVHGMVERYGPDVGVAVRSDHPLGFCGADAMFIEGETDVGARKILLLDGDYAAGGFYFTPGAWIKTENKGDDNDD